MKTTLRIMMDTALGMKDDSALRTWLSIVRWLFLLVLGSSLAGCVSTQDRYEKAVRLADEGRHGEAARYYVAVLEREADYRDARARLDSVGRLAVDMYLEAAQEADAAGRYEAAAEALADLDDLRLDAERVGVVLPVPADYSTFREEVTRAAIAALMERGDRAAEDHGWSRALEAYERAQQRYALTPEQHDAFDEARARVLVRWAGDEVRHDRHRSAYERAERAVDLLEPSHPLVEEARAIRDAAIERGTRAVAFLPFGAAEPVAETMPRAVLRDLNDVLLYEYWSDLPLFLALADPAATRRLLRQHYDHHPLTPRRIARLGRDVEADFVVTGSLTAFTWQEDDLEEETRRVDLRGRGRTGELRDDTSYTVQRFDLELEAELDYLIVDVRTRRVVDRGTERVAVEGPMHRVVYAGDPETLALSEGERDLFDDDRLRNAEQELVDGLVDRLAARLAEEVPADLLRQVE